MSGASFAPKTSWDAIEQHGISHLLLVPALLHALVSEPSFSSEKVTSVKYAIFGGDLITKDVLAKTKEAMPATEVLVGHGMTEGGGLFKWPFFDISIEDLPNIGGICPIGKVTQGSRLRIYDVDAGHVANRKEPAEFQVCSPSLIKHYLGEVNEDSFYEDEMGRWVKTGDLALIDENGVLFVLGRLSDRMKRSGVPITPAALESCIEKYNGSRVRFEPILKCTGVLANTHYRLPYLGFYI